MEQSKRGRDQSTRIGRNDRKNLNGNPRGVLYIHCISDATRRSDGGITPRFATPPGNGHVFASDTAMEIGKPIRYSMFFIPLSFHVVINCHAVFRDYYILFPF